MAASGSDPLMPVICLLIFDIVDRNTTGCLGWLPCCGGLPERASARVDGLAGDRGLNGQAGKKDEVLSKVEAGGSCMGALFSVCDGWLWIKRLRAFGGCLGTERR